MKVIKITPRGYCYGVVGALNMVQEAAANPDLPRPIYVLGMVVHNAHITQAMDELGLITLEAKDKTRLELLDEIPSGTVIFTAHGIAPAVKEKAIAKGLTWIDASCKDVIRTHELMKDYIGQGYEVLYIGKKGHPETEGALGVDADRIHLITGLEDLEGLVPGTDDLMITNQTTMSLWDVFTLAENIKKRFPKAEFIQEICNATQVRQEAVAKKAVGADLTIVVGDPHSNNTGRLAQVSEEKAGVPARRIASLEDLDLSWLEGIETVAVTSGASTPTVITKEVIDFLEAYDPQNPAPWDLTSKVSLDKILTRKS